MTVYLRICKHVQTIMECICLFSQHRLVLPSQYTDIFRFTIIDWIFLDITFSIVESSQNNEFFLKMSNVTFNIYIYLPKITYRVPGNIEMF